MKRKYVWIQIEKLDSGMKYCVIICALLFGSIINSQIAFAGCLPNITATTPTADFIVNGDGTVTHIKTGLMWKQCNEGRSGAFCAGGSDAFGTWQSALQAAQGANAGWGFAGYTDWRLPNQKELATLVERSCFGPSLNTTIFPNTQGMFWSSSPAAGVPASVHTIGFNGGRDYISLKNNFLLIRLVRGGK